jgi:hypothetical protein
MSETRFVSEGCMIEVFSLYENRTDFTMRVINCRYQV